VKEIKQRSSCPISSTLDFLGDKWSILILRDMMFDYKSTFGEFLNSPEKIATNILTDRLKNLEAEGFVFKHYVPGKARVGYSLTEKGISLVPLITEYIKWGISQNYLGKDPDHMKYISNHAEKFIQETMVKLKDRNQKLLESIPPDTI